MNINEKLILKALSTVDDPDLKKDLVSLGMIKDIEITGEKITFTVVLTTPACPLKELIRKNCVEAIEKEVGKDIEIEVKMTSNVTSSNTGNYLKGVKNIIGIASGKGGVGKSTVTTNLALSLAATGAKVGIIDADIFGPSIPTMFNCETARPGIIQKGEKNILMPVERYGIKLLSIGFLAPPEDAVIWRGPMASSALRQFITDTDWGELDYLLIDLPPGTSDIHLTLVQTIALTGAVIVTTPQKVALADAQKGLSMFTKKSINVPVLGVIENMAYFTPAELPDNKYYIFGKDGGKILAKRNQVPFLGEIPLVQSVREAGDTGVPLLLEAENHTVINEAFMGISQELARQIAVRNAAVEQNKKVEITRF
jgi:ATP-binding protein involved in chromosome partitioning